MTKSSIPTLRFKILKNILTKIHKFMITPLIVSTLTKLMIWFENTLIE